MGILGETPHGRGEIGDFGDFGSLHLQILAAAGPGTAHQEQPGGEVFRVCIAHPDLAGQGQALGGVVGHGVHRPQKAPDLRLAQL